MSGDLAGTWLRLAPAVELIRVMADGNGYSATVDRPSESRFREPIAVATGPSVTASIPEAVDITGNRPAVVSRGGSQALHRVRLPGPEEFARWCGWYDGGGRTLLLTQFAEGYFGDPMYLAAEGDAVVRAYPLSGRRLVREDGEVIELQSGGGQRRLVLRAGREDSLVLEATTRLREHEVTFASAGGTLSGTLVVPAGPGPHPAAVVLHGAAGGQRDFCRLLAGPLLDAGVAVLMYDKQGHGRSAGGTGPTIFDQADAACAGLDVLAATTGLDPARLGLVGFSNGMWAAPMAAARRGAVCFIAGIGSPGVTMAESEVHRRTKVLRDAGVGEQTLGIAAAAWRCIFSMAAAGYAPAALASELKARLAELSHAPDLDRYQAPDYVRGNPLLAAVPPSMSADELAGIATGKPDPELEYDPAADYRRLRCPVFLQYGSEDTSVPALASAERITDALRAAGAPKPVIRIYPGLEHQLNVVPDGISGMSPEEASYLFHRFRYGPRVRADLTTWLRDTTWTAQETR